MFKRKIRTINQFKNFQKSGVAGALCSALLMLPLFVGCNQTQNNQSQDSEGFICFNGVGIDNTVIDAETKVASSRLALDDVKVRIENTRAEVLKEWDSANDVPERIAAVGGSYKFVAYCGDASLLPSFGGEYFYGETKFAVVEGEETDVDLVVKHGETKVSVVFDTESFDYVYSDYSLDMRTTTSTVNDEEYLTYTASTTEEGNFLPGTLRMRLNVTPKGSDEEYVFYPEVIKNLKAAERRTLNFKVKNNSGVTQLEITTDDGYAYTEEIDLELPGSILPKDAPKIEAYNFTMGEVIEGTELTLPESGYSAAVRAAGGVKSVKVRTTSAAVQALWGGVSELEIVDATAEVKEMLNTTGFRWDNALDSSASANVEYGKFFISFGDLFASLSDESEEGYTDYGFEIEVVDMFGQSNINSQSGEGAFNFTLRVTSSK